MVSFSLNGTSLGKPYHWNIENKKLLDIYPCVDLYTQSDKVTIL